MQDSDAISNEIPFFRYAHVFAQHREEYLAAMMRVLEQGSFILQKDVQLFEQELSAFVGCKHAIGVGNATDALTMILRAIGIRVGDEVIIPAHTFVASAAAVHWAGGTPVVCDIGPDNLIDPRSAESLITSRTRAIMPVQLNGRTSDMDPIIDLALKYKLEIIEDSSQALGSKFKGRASGTWGRAGVFSFYPAKLIGAFGDAGAVVTNDEKLAANIRLLRDHGRGRHGGEIEQWGMNSRLDTLQAAVLRVKLSHYPQEISHRRQIAAIYKKGLNGIPGLWTPPGPSEKGPHYDVFQNYEICCEQRDALKRWLDNQKIYTIMQWAGKGLHQFPGLRLKANVPAADNFFKRCLLLPMNSSVNADEAARVVKSIQMFFT